MPTKNLIALEIIDAQRSRWEPSEPMLHLLFQMVSVDFIVVPTATFQLLFVFVVLAHERRRVVHSM